MPSLPDLKGGTAGDKEGYKLYTMDHSTGSLRLDMEHKWQSSQPPQAVLPPPDQMCDDEVQLAFPELFRLCIQDKGVLFISALCASSWSPSS